MAKVARKRTASAKTKTAAKGSAPRAKAGKKATRAIRKGKNPPGAQSAKSAKAKRVRGDSAASRKPAVKSRAAAKKKQPAKKSVPTKKRATAKKKSARVKKKLSTDKKAPTKKKAVGRKAARKKSAPVKKNAKKNVRSSPAALKEAATRKKVANKPSARTKSAARLRAGGKSAAGASSHSTHSTSNQKKVSKNIETQVDTSAVEDAETAVNAAPPKPVYPKSFLEKQRRRLLSLRDELVDTMAGVARGNLREHAEGSEASAFGMHQADAGSDAYDRDLALNLLSQEQNALYEIEEALVRIDAGTYGVCEISGEKIIKERLEAIPFARLTVKCQQELEKQNRFNGSRASGPIFKRAHLS